MFAVVPFLPRFAVCRSCYCRWRWLRQHSGSGGSGGGAAPAGDGGNAFVGLDGSAGLFRCDRRFRLCSHSFFLYVAFRLLLLLLVASSTADGCH